MGEGSGGSAYRSAFEGERGDPFLIALQKEYEKRGAKDFLVWADGQGLKIGYEGYTRGSVRNWMMVRRPDKVWQFLASCEISKPVASFLREYDIELEQLKNLLDRIKWTANELLEKLETVNPFVAMFVKGREQAMEQIKFNLDELARLEAENWTPLTLRRKELSDEWAEKDFLGQEIQEDAISVERGELYEKVIEIDHKIMEIRDAVDSVPHLR